MVRQLLTVTRLESGALHPRSEVVSLATRVRKAWEALGAADVPFTLDDQAGGWLAVADADQLDQVLWALLDNAVKYGGRTPVKVEVTVDEAASQLRTRVSDGGPGFAEMDQSRLFGRFERGPERTLDEGSGLGLYVSRELCRAMGGDLVLEPTTVDHGSAMVIVLPGEAPESFESAEDG
jgi:signal transduction histidine kinase